MIQFSPKQLGKALGLSESTLKRWIDAGQLNVERTVGGHRRVSQPEAIRFIRQQKLRILNPALLGLNNDLVQGSAIAPDNHADALTHMLSQNQVDDARTSILRAYLDGATLSDLFDQVLRPALYELGERWGCPGNENWAGIADEHIATEACIRAVSEIRALIPSAPDDAPRAIGMAPAGDPYILPGLMAATALAELGLNVINLGPNAPTQSFNALAERYDKPIGFISVTSPPSERVISDLRHTIQAWVERGDVLILGGQSHRLVLPDSSDKSATPIRTDSIAELTAYVRGLFRSH
ncbi:MAG: cobalamin B12-binding domain-containing protein [Planctomycetota bacterium]|jgi:excisionase family DNA binding protein